MKLFYHSIPDINIVVAVLANTEYEVEKLILQSNGKTGGRVFYFSRKGNMGFTPVDEMSLSRDYKTREIIISWTDTITGKHEKRFTFEQKKEALEFAAKEFNQLAM